MAGLGEAPAPAAPGLVEEEEEEAEEGVVETVPLDTTTQRRKRTLRMDRWAIRQTGLKVKWKMRREEDGSYRSSLKLDVAIWIEKLIFRKMNWIKLLFANASFQF